MLVLMHIHSFSSLSYDRSKASSKASSPFSVISSFLLQMRESSPFLKVIQSLLTSSSSSSCHFYPAFDAQWIKNILVQAYISSHMASEDKVAYPLGNNKTT